MRFLGLLVALCCFALPIVAPGIPASSHGSPSISDEVFWHDFLFGHGRLIQKYGPGVRILKIQKPITGALGQPNPHFASTIWAYLTDQDRYVFIRRATYRFGQWFEPGQPMPQMAPLDNGRLHPFDVADMRTLGTGFEGARNMIIQHLRENKPPKVLEAVLAKRCRHVTLYMPTMPLTIGSKYHKFEYKFSCDEGDQFLINGAGDEESMVWRQTPDHKTLDQVDGGQ